MDAMQTDSFMQYLANVKSFNDKEEIGTILGHGEVDGA